MQDSVVGDAVIIKIRVVLSLVVVEYRAVVIPAHLRTTVRLGIRVRAVWGSERQPLERDIN